MLFFQKPKWSVLVLKECFKKKKTKALIEHSRCIVFRMEICDVPFFQRFLKPLLIYVHRGIKGGRMR